LERRRPLSITVEPGRDPTAQWAGSCAKTLEIPAMGLAATCAGGG